MNESKGSVRLGMDGRGMAWRGEVWQGQLGHGKAWLSSLTRKAVICVA